MAFVTIETQADADVTASALHEYMTGRWLVSDLAADPTDDGWVRPGRLFLNLVDRGARPHDAAFVYLVDALRRDLPEVTA